MRKVWLNVCLVGLLTTTGGVAPRAQTPAKTAGSGMDLARLKAIDAVVEQAIAERKTPGAVVLIGRGDATVYEKAYGNRAVVPRVEAMTVNTVFDLASLTKVVATTTAVMMLVENGQIRLNDTVASFIPEFGKYGKARVTVHDLLTHTSGLRPDLDLADPWVGADTAIKLASEEVLTSTAPHPFVYSDINYELLGEIVGRVSHMPLDQFVHQRIFEPLGMHETMFLPPAALRPRIAPTQPCPRSEVPCGIGPVPADVNVMLRGVVHDPTARRMGGVAGHAGLFSTAQDLAIFCRMLLNGGTVGGARILSPLTVSRMTAPGSPSGESNVRGFGWDLDSAYSSNRGELLPLGSFGHTGFTGTSIWIDPATRLFVVFLANRVHPDGTGDVTPLRARVATIAASAVTDVSSDLAQRLDWPRQDVLGPAGVVTRTPSAPVQTGIDVLRADNFGPLKGLRVGLLTNHTGRSRDGTATIDLLAGASTLKLAALFSPEHGIRGILDAAVPSSKDEKTGLPIYSLYGATTRPTSEMLAGLDAIVIDLQDVGTRFYTYITTVGYVMEEAAARKIKVFVLDRPNPIGGVQIEGPSLDQSAVGFTGYFPQMPIRHGMTLGEIARLFNGERKMGADLTVIAMKNWRRDDWFDDTALSWVNPSPNMRNLYEAALYPGIGAIEGTNVSVGRGTDTPFEQVGAPWIDGPKLSDALNARQLPGVRFYPVRFTPSSSKFANQECQGVFIIVTDRQALRPVRVGVEIASAVKKLFPSQFEIDSAARLFGSAVGLGQIKVGDDPATIAGGWRANEARWRQLRAKYLLYF
jgi:uncharacterized protein YbbC (DUF1343 family)/CubicO group peptidase (beta-lactamase class C family)